MTGLDTLGTPARTWMSNSFSGCVLGKQPRRSAFLF